MKQIIRYGTFETNSSSMHSLVVVKDPKPYDYDDTSFDLGVWGNEFYLFWHNEGNYGRSPFQVLRTPMDKLRYYVAYYIGNCKKNNLIRKVKNFIHKQTNIDINKINIKSYNELWEDEKDEYKGYGYASLNDTGEDVFVYIEKNNISMEEFVLNPKYIVIVDGDEYQEFRKLFESNILDANDFEYISSGVGFWNKDTYTIRLNAIESDNQNLYKDLEKVTSKFIKNIKLDIDDWTLGLYDKYFPTLRDYFGEVKRQRPDIKIGIIYVKEDRKLIDELDLSIFDYREELEKEYDDEGKIIEIKK